MELISSIEFKDIETFPNIGGRANLCTISKKNLVAFTAPKCYKFKKAGNVHKGDGKQTKIQDCDFGDFGGVADTLFVCPLSSPWTVHVVIPMDSELKQVVWDPSGTKLLTADASGQVFLWQMHESVLNKWMYSNFTRSMYGDDIISLKWINSTHLFTIAKDVTKQTTFDKKYPLVCANAVSGSIGNRSVDTWVAVTSAGVVALGIAQQKTEMVVWRTGLESFEDRKLTSADIMVEPNGSIQVITTTGSIRDPIRQHKLTVEISTSGYYIQPSTCLFSSECSSCFFVDKCTDSDSIVSIQYLHPLTGHTVLVALHKPRHAELQQWTRCEETLGLHTTFHANTIIPEKNFHWIRQTSAQLTGHVTAHAVNPLLCEHTSMFPLGAAFASDDMTLGFVSRLSLSDVQTVSAPRTHPDERIVSLAFSPNGCVCVAMTTRLRMLVLGRSSLTVEHLSTLLEYDLLTGHTWEDVLVCLKSDSTLIEKVSVAMDASLAKQSAGIQAQYKTKLDILKIGMAMASESTLTSCADRLTALLLQHVRNSFMSILSTSEYEECEQSAEEKFTAILSSPANISELDIDKLISLLEPSSDFLPDESVGVTFQPTVQWVCELTITILSSIPDYTSPATSGSWLAKDLKSVDSLRELLVLIRLWAGANTLPKLRPTLSCSAEFDALAKLFRLVTMLSTAVREGNSLPDTLVEECSLISYQLVIPPFEKSICWSQLPALLALESQSTYTFGEGTVSVGCFKLPFGQYCSNGKKDIFTQIAVNSLDEYKRCVRCHAMTNFNRHTPEQPKTRANMAPHYCICGGLWFVVPS